LKKCNANYNSVRSIFSNRLTILNLRTQIQLLKTENAVGNVRGRTFANHKHKKIIKLAKGYRGRANRCFTVAKHRVQKARQYAYRDRKVKKREFRSLWIQRINAACRMYGLPYSKFMSKLVKSDITLNRKVLADLAVSEPLSFKSVVEIARQSN